MTLMKLYAFSDFHLSGDPPTKPMDIFGPAWNNHREKIINAWMETIHPEDTVIMAGDLSWAMHIQDAISDLKMLGTLHGRKIIVRGNHDYWWDTVTKMTRMTDGAFEFIHNSALSVGPIAIAGTRGWIAETSRKLTEADKPIILREEGRLERSLELASKMNPERIIAVLHYPPFDELRNPTHMLQLMTKYHVTDCVYGHIHGAMNFQNLPEELEGIRLHLTSADYLDFKPHLLYDHRRTHARLRRQWRKRRHRNGTSVGNHRKKKPQTNHTSCIRKEYDGIIDKAIKKECEKSSIFSHSFFAISPNGKRVFYHSSNVFRYSLNPGPMSSLLRANSTMALR